MAGFISDMFSDYGNNARRLFKYGKSNGNYD